MEIVWKGDCKVLSSAATSIRNRDFSGGRADVVYGRTTAGRTRIPASRLLPSLAYPSSTGALSCRATFSNDKFGNGRRPDVVSRALSTETVEAAKQEEAASQKSRAESFVAMVEAGEDVLQKLSSKMSAKEAQLAQLQVGSILCRV